MPRKPKKSFFERLTGVITIDHDEYDEEDVEIAPSRKNFGSFPEDQVEDDIVEDEIIQPSEGELGIDMYQTHDDIFIKAMVASVRPEDLDISITRDMVTIRGHREDSTTIDDEHFFQRELYWGAFSRTILLPQEIDVDAADATVRHGLLIIKLPKIDKSRQTRLKVKATP